MESLGFAISVVQMLGVFQNCLTLYDQVRNLQRKDTDLFYYNLKLQFEQRKLIELKQNLETSTAGTAANTLIYDFLQLSEKTLREVHDLVSKYSDVPKNSKSTKKATRALSWVASDKERLQILVERLKVLNDDLIQLIPRSEKMGLEFKVMAEAIASSDTKELRQVQQVSGAQYPDTAVAAEIKALRLESFKQALVGQPAA
jgi:Prion-inhibition and propagation